jgi:signal peptidase I
VTRRRLLTVLLVIACANVAVFVVQRVAFTPLKVPTQSMWPTLQKGDRIAVDHTVPLKDLEQGDLVVFAVSKKSNKPVRTSSENSKLLVKRVIAGPGQTIEAHKGYIVVEKFDRRLEEPYLRGRIGSTEIPFMRVNDDAVYVLGDNRDNSVDSREFGPVPERAVVGRVAFRYWPPRRFRKF